MFARFRLTEAKIARSRPALQPTLTAPATLFTGRGLYWFKDFVRGKEERPAGRIVTVDFHTYTPSGLLVGSKRSEVRAVKLLLAAHWAIPHEEIALSYLTSDVSGSFIDLRADRT